MPASAQTAADATLGKLTLRVQAPAGTTQTVVLTSACCRIGSGDGCTLRLRAPGIRDVHCVIFRGPRRTVVRGLAKETWLNGAVFFESPLNVGDRLGLGRLEIEVLTDERLTDEGEATSLDDSTLPPPDADGGSLREGAARGELPAESASPRPAEAAALLADASGQLEELVAHQTAEFSAAVASETPCLPEHSHAAAGAGGDRPQAAAIPQEEARDAAASLVAEALEKVRGVEDRLDERLGKLQDQSRQLERAIGDVCALRSAGEDECRQLRAEQQQAEAAWRQSFGDLDSRVKELAAAAAIPRAATGGKEPGADWRQLDERQAVLERLVGQEDQQYGKASQQLEAVLARVAQVEATLAKAETSGQAVESRLAQVERLELKLAELACQRGAQSAAYDELQRRFASLETELVAARSYEPARDAGTRAPADETDRAPRPDRGALDGPPREAAAAAESSTFEEPQPEEVAFEPVSQEAPLSTLDVLRRMGATVNFADDEESPAPPRASARPVPARPPVESPQPSPGAGHADRHGGRHEDGEAIEQYMSQLLQRMRAPKAEEVWGELSPPPKADSPTPPPPSPREVAPAASPSAPTSPNTPSQFVPRALAPELTADFSAMRALANNTARHALDTHRRGRQVRSTRGKLVVAAIALALSFTLLWLSTSGSSLVLWSAVTSLLVSVYWGGRYLLLTRRLRGVAEKDDDAGATATAGGGVAGAGALAEAPAEVPTNVALEERLGPTCIPEN